MSDEAKPTDSVSKPPHNTATAQITAPSGKVLGELKQSIDGMPGIPNLGKLYIALTLVGFLVVVFAYMMWSGQQASYRQQEVANEAIKNTQSLMDGQLTRLITELSVARKEAREDRQEMMGRYLESRGTADKRHADILVKLDKVVLWIESVFTTLWRERAGGKGSEALMPKIPK